MNDLKKAEENSRGYLYRSKYGIFYGYIPVTAVAVFISIYMSTKYPIRSLVEPLCVLYSIIIANFILVLILRSRMSILYHIHNGKLIIKTKKNTEIIDLGEIRILRRLGRIFGHVVFFKTRGHIYTIFDDIGDFDLLIRQIDRSA